MGQCCNQKAANQLNVNHHPPLPQAVPSGNTQKQHHSSIELRPPVPTKTNLSDVKHQYNNVPIDDDPESVSLASREDLLVLIEVLLRKGFAKHYVTRALSLYEKHYGSKYNIKIIEEIIYRLSVKDKLTQQKSVKNLYQSRDAVEEILFSLNFSINNINKAFVMYEVMAEMFDINQQNPNIYDLELITEMIMRLRGKLTQTTSDTISDPMQIQLFYQEYVHEYGVPPTHSKYLMSFAEQKKGKRLDERETLNIIDTNRHLNSLAATNTANIDSEDLMEMDADQSQSDGDMESSSHLMDVEQADAGNLYHDFQENIEYENQYYDVPAAARQRQQYNEKEAVNKHKYKHITQALHPNAALTGSKNRKHRLKMNGYEWIQRTLKIVDHEYHVDYLSNFEEYEVTDDMLSDLLAEDWKQLIPEIGPRNEFKKLWQRNYKNKSIEVESYDEKTVTIPNSEYTEVSTVPQPNDADSDELRQPLKQEDESSHSYDEESAEEYEEESEHDSYAEEEEEESEEYDTEDPGEESAYFPELDTIISGHDEPVQNGNMETDTLEITLIVNPKRVIDSNVFDRTLVQEIIRNENGYNAHTQYQIYGILDTVETLKQHKKYKLMQQLNETLSDNELVALVYYTDESSCCHKTEPVRTLTDGAQWKELYFHTTNAVVKLHRVFHYKNKNKLQCNMLYHSSTITALDVLCGEQFFLKMLCFSSRFAVEKAFAVGSMLVIDNVAESLQSGRLRGADVSWISQWVLVQVIVLPTVHYQWKEVSQQAMTRHNWMVAPDLKIFIASDCEAPNDMNEKLKCIKEWLQNTVCLKESDAKKYLGLFIANGYESLNGVQVIDSRQDLVEIGIVKKGHIKQILFHVRSLDEYIEKFSQTEWDEQKTEDSAQNETSVGNGCNVVKCEWMHIDAVSVNKVTSAAINRNEREHIAKYHPRLHRRLLSMRK